MSPAEAEMEEWLALLALLDLAKLQVHGTPPSQAEWLAAIARVEAAGGAAVRWVP